MQNKYGWLTRGFVVGGVTLIGILAVGGTMLLVVTNNSRRANSNSGESGLNSEISSAQTETASEAIPENYIKFGGVVRPKRDVVPAKKHSNLELNREPLIPVGTIPSLKKDKNVYTQSVAQAIESNDQDLAYRLTPFKAAPKFDHGAYLADPESYLNEIAPGRIYDVLPDSFETPATRRVGRYRYKVLQGETIILRAKTEPEMPVTFYSSRLGSFNGGVSTVTVAADEQGIAQAEFKTTTGMYGEIDIVAASPVRSGQARYLVDVRLPTSN